MTPLSLATGNPSLSGGYRFDGTNITAYVNGAYVGTATLQLGLPCTTIGQRIRLSWAGRRIRTNRAYLTGSITEFRIYNHGSKMAAQFAADYAAGANTLIPEPATIVLLITGLIGLLAYAWRKRK